MGIAFPIIGVWWPIVSVRLARSRRDGLRVRDLVLRKPKRAGWYCREAADGEAVRVTFQ